MKKILKSTMKYGLMGALIGLLITTVLAFIFSENGEFAFMNPLLNDYGSEYRGALISVVLSMVNGFFWGATVVLFEIESLFILRATIINFIINFTQFTVIGSLLHWFKITKGNFLGFLFIFTFIYFIIWTIIYFIEKSKVTKINLALKEKANNSME